MHDCPPLGYSGSACVPRVQGQRQHPRKCVLCLGLALERATWPRWLAVAGRPAAASGILIS